MTGRANDQGFAPFFEHDLHPRRSIFSHLCQIGQFAYLVNHALFIFDGTEFTRTGYESSHHLLFLIAHHGRDSINQDSLLVAHQRNAAKAGDQRFLASTADESCLKALSETVRRLDDGLKAFGYRSGAGVIFGGQGVS